jgi:hypothetical protein
MTQLRDLARRCALAKHLLDGIAGHDVDQQDKRQDEPESGEGEKDAFEDVVRHAMRTAWRERRASDDSLGGTVCFL